MLRTIILGPQLSSWFLYQRRSQMQKRLQLKPGETGLAEISEVWANGITTVRKADILPPRSQLRKLSRATVCQIMKHVILSVGILPTEIAG